ncbi:MAG: hypothetical protein KA521_04535 [Crocinitomicaceae bacterium]|nr:hypothetical protein [Crocinitomicaceae bacterium]
MKEGLTGPIVEQVAVAIVQELSEKKEFIYNAYLLNLRDDIMEGIIISVTGYGENPTTGEAIKTATLRHSLEVLLPNEAAKIEPLMEEVFAINNEFWISFWVNDDLFDKKFVFPAGTIQPEKMELIPLLGFKGMLIQ